MVNNFFKNLPFKTFFIDNNFIFFLSKKKIKIKTIKYAKTVAIGSTYMLLYIYSPKKQIIA